MALTTKSASAETANVTLLRTDENLPPVGVDDKRPMSLTARIVLALIAILGGVSWVMIAVVRGENPNAMWFVFAAICSYIIAYRFYGKLIERKIAKPKDTEATPAEILENGHDYMPTDRRIVFGHHFAAIAGAGPLVGPILAAQMGYLPGTIWIIVGVILAGAVQDYLSMWLSVKRRGRSLGQIARDELGAVGGYTAIIGILVIMSILLAVLCIVIVGALAESPWGVFSIAMTIPIAIFMGVYLRYLRPGRVSEVSAIGVVLLLLAIVAGGWVADSSLASFFTLTPVALSWCLIIYGFIAAVLPVWLLLAPRDYLSTFMKVGTVALIAVGLLIVRPAIEAPAFTRFAFDSEGPVFAGGLFPFLFITIACGALSGFHSLVSTGTTPKLLAKQSQARFIGYGGMLVESFVAMTAMVAACIIDQNLYFAINAPAALTGGTAETAAAYVNTLNLGNAPIDAAQISALATEVGEESVVSRTGGAPTFAIGMSDILASFLIGSKAFWYHFAIMFEALFILTTIDAGTRIARFMLSDALGNIKGCAKFRNPSWTPGAWLCTAVMVAGWGSILLMGVTDPMGGINTLYPLFGIANQLLAAIALTVIFAVVIKKGLAKWAWIPGIPLAFDLVVTLTASWQKVFSDDPAIGYWKQNSQYKDAKAQGLTTFGAAKSPEDLEAIIRNTFIQGTLSIVFALVVVVVFIVAMGVCLKAFRVGRNLPKNADGSNPDWLPTSEDAPIDSQIFAPSGFLASDVEREIQAEWDALEAAPAGVPEKVRS
jgi:carbon starvation protein